MRIYSSPCHTTNILLPCHVMLLSCLISPKLGEHLVSSLLIPLLNTTYIAVDQIPWLHKKWAAGEATILNGTKDSTAANAQTVDYIICRIFHAISGHMIIITCYRVAPSSSRKYHCKFRRLITKQTLCSAIIISPLVFRSPTVIIYFVRARICQRSHTRLPFPQGPDDLVLSTRGFVSDTDTKGKNGTGRQVKWLNIWA